MSETHEAVALELLRVVANGESKHLGNEGVDRKYVLDTYAECLQAVKFPVKHLGN